ncbi:3-hydroxyisobutyrate dehydrogenase [Salpingoeca rosetta]|uniref:3-hydroxyisobutyrate dehydrogenase n=1 Tax=Salpingoeca rosetta (strain ATCC 50818 / BSB-021) TaxID=946362 RepID=F2U1I0_SALR5|nr:3-hydroxyisobutyrate dehydrogenase [Salpingoeca rosetta]EGD81482.1 3-hydroxyisobutyrate dehydrogenase [Salpingoeca rosetta]|eukprot:XP_004996686.1 3-hydroxyisobutyrate dehydrogenase [Salpingoeca rosetta]
MLGRVFVRPVVRSGALLQGVRCLSVSASAQGQRVGFIGLGNMGGHMARNLGRAGCSLVLHDVNADIANSIASDCADATVVHTAAEVTSQVDTVVTMLPANQHVSGVYRDEAGIFSAMQPNSLLIDASTIDPLLSKDLAAEAAKRGAVMIDAPVSGGVGGAEAGTLTFMVGGTDEAFGRASDVLKHMGKNLVHCGSNGTGQVAKICNNMLLAIGMIGTAEAMNMGKRLGMDPKVLAGIINTSTGRCWSSDTYNPCPGVMDGVPSSRNYEGGFGTALMAKNLGLPMDAAGESKDEMESFCEGEYAGRDFSSVFKMLSGEGLSKDN